MKYIQIAVFASFLFAGCAGRVNYDDVSEMPGFKDWIGKRFKIKSELFLVSEPLYDKPFLMPPDPWLPPMDYYKNKQGKDFKINIFLDPEVIGVASVGSEYKIIAIGYYVFNRMIGKTGVVVVKDKFDKEYYIRGRLFYFGNNNTFTPHEGYIEMCQNNLDEGALKMNAIIISYTHDGWRDYNDTGETVGDVILVKITKPNKYAGREITIIDDNQVFRKAGLTEDGKVVTLALYDDIQIDGENDEFFVSAFRDIRGYEQDIPCKSGSCKSGSDLKFER